MRYNPVQSFPDTSRKSEDTEHLACSASRRPAITDRRASALVPNEPPDVSSRDPWHLALLDMFVDELNHPSVQLLVIVTVYEEIYLTIKLKELPSAVHIPRVWVEARHSGWWLAGAFRQIYGVLVTWSFLETPRCVEIDDVNLARMDFLVEGELSRGCNEDLTLIHVL